MSRIKNQPIAVRLKRQPVLEVCEEALSYWKRKTRFKSFEVSVINRLEGENPKSWVDTALFNRAIANLLEIAARECGARNRISFSIIPGWQGVCRLVITAPLKAKLSNSDNDDMNFRPDWDAREIISQHRGKIEVEEGRQHNRFMIYLPC